MRLFLRGLRQFLLLLRMIEYGGAILGALVSALLILAGRVMQFPEPRQNVRSLDLLGVIYDLHYLDMSGVFLADLLICGIRHEPSHVAGYH